MSTIIARLEAELAHLRSIAAAYDAEGMQAPFGLINDINVAEQELFEAKREQLVEL